ncbi:MAG: hypothetical protein LC808_26000 [Actinobacteria bacterium]|nr:hypothetical protein [Actinomycetota bacterium]
MARGGMLNGRRRAVIRCIGRPVDSREVAFLALAILLRTFLRYGESSRRLNPSRLFSSYEDVILLQKEDPCFRDLLNAAGSPTASTMAVDGVGQDEAGDVAWDTLAEAMVMRTALAALCEELLVAVTVMEQRLDHIMDDDLGPLLGPRSEEAPSRSSDHIARSDEPWLLAAAGGVCATLP